MARGAREQLEPADQTIADKALKALDTAAAQSFDVGASVAAIQQEVEAAGKGGAAPSPQVLGPRSTGSRNCAPTTPR